MRGGFLMKKVYCKPVMESEEFNVRQHVATSCNHHCKIPSNKPHWHPCPTHFYPKSDEKTCEETTITFLSRLNQAGLINVLELKS